MKLVSMIIALFLPILCIGQMANIQINVFTEFQEGIEGVQVAQEKTDAAGWLSLELPSNTGQVTLSPSKEAAAVECLSEADLDLLDQIIFSGPSGFSPYQLIAADVNGDRVIDKNDWNLLEDIIFNGSTLSSPWVFVLEEFQFPDVLNPFSTNFPNAYAFNDLNFDEIKVVNFVGIHRGNIDANYSCLLAGTKDIKAATLAVFPNPTDGLLSIDGPMAFSSATSTIHLYQANGKIIDQISYDGATAIDLSHLTAGYYFGQFLIDDVSYQFSFVKS